MQVILLERIEKLGQMGDVVSVKPGFARNYLLPQGKARRATKENLARRDEAQKVAEKMDGLTVTLIRQAGESGQLYGSVNARNLAETITEAGFTVTRDQIALDQVIKALGLHQVRVRLHPEVSAAVTANVARSQAEAEQQAATGHILSAEEVQAAAAAAAAAAEEALAKLEAEGKAEDTAAEAEAGEPKSEDA
jgi:large subunit ribosomal protein L9